MEEATSVNFWLYIAIFFMFVCVIFACVLVEMHVKEAAAKKEANRLTAENKALQNTIDIQKGELSKITENYNDLHKEYTEGGPLIRHVSSHVPIVWLKASQRFDQDLMKHQVGLDEEEFFRTIVESVLRRDLVDKILSDHLYFEETLDDPTMKQTVKTVRIGVAAEFDTSGVEF